MAVELKLSTRIAVGHCLDVFVGIHRIEDAEGVGQQISQDTLILQTVHHVPHVVAAVAHALRPVLKIEVHVHPFGMGVVDDALDVGNMLIGRLL